MATWRLTAGGRSVDKETTNESPNSHRSATASPAERIVDTSSTRRTTQKPRLIWLDGNIDGMKKQYHQSFVDLRRIVDPILTFSDANQCAVSFYEIEQHEKVFMIVAGGLGQNIVPSIHDAAQLDSVFVFCQNIARHQQWTKDWSKVKGVFDKIDQMYQAIERAVQPRDAIQPRLEKIPSTPTPADRHAITPDQLLKPTPPERHPITPAQLLKPTSSDRHPMTSEQLLKPTPRDTSAVVDHHQQETNHKHDRRVRSASQRPVDSDRRADNPTLAGPHKIERETPVVASRKKPDVTEGPSRPPRLAFVEATTPGENQQETARRSEKQKPSFVHPFDDNASSSSSLVNSAKATAREMPNSQQKLPSDFEQLQRTLIETTERQLRKTLLNNDDIYRTTTLTVDRLRDTIVETVDKHDKTKKNDSDAMNKMFIELKQVLVDTLVEQQQQQQNPTILRDLIKQTVYDALKEQQNSSSGLTTTTTLAKNHRKPITLATGREVKITANIKLTRTDAAFRQQRDTVVANKQLRDVVQQWSSVSAMINLVTQIKKYGKNDLEYAWLLFAWIGQNIQYQPYCNNNAAETVMRTKQGVCRGFVSLYHECCTLLGIECSEISGYAKQGFLKPGEELKQSPHAWNSIRLDEHTYLLDSTWGAGGRDNARKLEDFYFLTSPEELIYTHYCNGYQLLDPEISKKEFLSLPVMKSTYYQLGLHLLSPKQGFNETSQNLFKIAIRTPEYVDLFTQLKIGDTEYPRTLHTLCQRDETMSDVFNCFITPPVDGLYEIAIYAKTKDENSYRETICMRLRVTNIVDAFTFPLIYTTFTEHNCILIEPLQRLVHVNEEVLIHMIIPRANVLKIRNGDDYMVPCSTEYKKGILKKKLIVQGELHICARWDDNADTISTICIFNLI